MEDLYVILGISRDATKEDISKAYRGLAVKYHPDSLPKGLTEDERSAAISKFKKIASAYETLVDPQKRTIHDLQYPKPKPKPNTKNSTRKNPKTKAEERAEWIRKNDPNMGSCHTPPPPNFDIWGKPLSQAQKEQWMKDMGYTPLQSPRNFRHSPKKPTYSRPKWRDDFYDAYSKYYEDNDVPNLRI